MWRSGGSFCFAAVTTAPLAAETANQTKEQPQFGWREMWGGADATKDVWLLYTGVTLAPLSKDIYSDGLRLRMTSGYGQYSCNGNILDCGKVAVGANSAPSPRIGSG